MPKTKINKDCLHENCLLCQHVTPEWLELIEQHRQVLNFKKGQHIFTEGSKVEGMFFILSGKVKIEMSWGERSHIVRLAKDGDILGHRGFGLDDIYPASGIAVAPTSVCFVPTDFFVKLLKTNTQLLFRLTFLYADELKKTERKLRNLAHVQVKGRVAEALLDIREAYGTDDSGVLGHRMSRKDIASIAGTTYESVVRMLNELVADNLIALVGMDIKLLDVDRLATVGHN